MPLYDFACTRCENRFETFIPLAQLQKAVACSKCGAWAKRIIVLGHGGFQSTEPKWLDDEVRGCLQDTDAVAAGTEKPIEDRADYDRYLKQHSIVPLQ